MAEGINQEIEAKARWSLEHEWLTVEQIDCETIGRLPDGRTRHMLRVVVTRDDT